MPETSVITYAIPSTEEKERSGGLVLHRLCPHCGNKISLSDAISMVFGLGWDQGVKVQMEDGSIGVLSASKVNPQKVRVLG